MLADGLPFVGHLLIDGRLGIRLLLEILGGFGLWFSVAGAWSGMASGQVTEPPTGCQRPPRLRAGGAGHDRLNSDSARR